MNDLKELGKLMKEHPIIIYYCCNIGGDGCRRNFGSGRVLSGVVRVIFCLHKCRLNDTEAIGYGTWKTEARKY